eukprot:6621702-Prymnesium_polylepis.1
MAAFDSTGCCSTATPSDASGAAAATSGPMVATVSAAGWGRLAGGAEGGACGRPVQRTENLPPRGLAVRTESKWSESSTCSSTICVCVRPPPPLATVYL